MALLNLNPESYIEAIWFIAWQQNDWMAAVMRDNDSAPWRAAYRFRWSTSNDPWCDDDRKSLYEITSTEKGDAGRDLLVDAMDHLAPIVEITMWPVHISTKLVIQAHGDRATDILAQQPWVHFKLAHSHTKGTH